MIATEEMFRIFQQYRGDAIDNECYATPANLLLTARSTRRR